MTDRTQYIDSDYFERGDFAPSYLDTLPPTKFDAVIPYRTNFDSLWLKYCITGRILTLYRH